MALLSDRVGERHGFLAEETLDATASVGITAAIIKPSGAAAPAQCALITNNHATIHCRFRLSGSAATTSTGHQLKAGDSILLWNTSLLRNFRIIGESGSPAVGVTTFV